MSRPTDAIKAHIIRAVDFLQENDGFEAAQEIERALEKLDHLETLIQTIKTKIVRLAELNGIPN